MRKKHILFVIILLFVITAQAKMQSDTMAAYYERMQRWKALHGWTDRWESEK